MICGGRCSKVRRRPPIAGEVARIDVGRAIQIHRRHGDGGCAIAVFHQARGLGLNGGHRRQVVADEQGAAGGGGSREGQAGGGDAPELDQAVISGWGCRSTRTRSSLGIDKRADSRVAAFIEGGSGEGHSGAGIADVIAPQVVNCRRHSGVAVYDECG